MIEQQAINKVLQLKSMVFLTQNSVDENYFTSCQKEFLFIKEHYERYGVVPDQVTFADAFTDFDLFVVDETEQYILETLRENYLYAKTVPFVQKIADLALDNAHEAVEYARTALVDLTGLTSAILPGTDIVKGSKERIADLQARQESKGLLGISTGFSELDEWTHGWVTEDLVSVMGRPNEGKSWVLLRLLLSAQLSGKRVLLYSGEMSVTAVQQRYDTLRGGFSNAALMRGGKFLGDATTPLSIEDYIRYAVELQQDEKNEFIVVTPRDLRQRLSVPLLHQLIERHKPDIIGIDQLSLMVDARSRRNDQERNAIYNLTTDLYGTTEKYQIPILLAVQAGRKSKDKKGDGTSTPELGDAYGSDGIEQNSTRVLALKQVDKTLKIFLAKNRYGMNNKQLMLTWNIDRGIFTPFTEAINAPSKSKEVTGRELDGVDLF